MLRHAAAWVLWWIALFWLWMLLVGDWNHFEWIGGACVATVAASVAEAGRTVGDVHARIPLAWVVKAWSVLPIVVADFGILVWALVEAGLRRRVRRGVFRARHFAPEGDGDTAFGLRAWVMVLATYSPNAYVVDVDPDRDLALVHDLVPWKQSESPL